MAYPAAVYFQGILLLIDIFHDSNDLIIRAQVVQKRIVLIQYHIQALVRPVQIVVDLHLHILVQAAAQPVLGYQGKQDDGDSGCQYEDWQQASSKRHLSSHWPPSLIFCMLSAASSNMMRSSSSPIIDCSRADTTVLVISGH